MGTILVFANQKGGVGKTTSTANIGAYIAEAGKSVLLIDFDPQANLTTSVGADKEKAGIYEAIVDKESPDKIIQSTAVEKLGIISSNINLTGANVELVDQERREFFLKNTIVKIKNSFDYILIDCPPSLGILTLNGLVSADHVIIPLQCEYFALEGLTQLLQSIKSVQNSYNENLSLGGIIFTMYDSRIKIAHEVVEEVVGYFGNKVFKTIIPRNVRLSEAPSHGIPINLYDPNCIGAKGYRQLAEEVIKRV
jgi:chromosome partitioning protein